jgi:transposase
MAHPPEIRARLRAAYVHERLSLEQAGARLEVSAATARRWKLDAERAGDDWDRARSATRLAGDGMAQVAQMILEDYLLLHQSTIEGVKSDLQLQPLQKAEVLSKLADAFTKTMSAVGKASPELSKLSVATDVLQRFAAFVGTRHPHLAEGMLEVIEPFAASLARDYA